MKSLGLRGGTLLYIVQLGAIPEALIEELEEDALHPELVMKHAWLATAKKTCKSRPRKTAIIFLVANRSLDTVL